MRHDLALLRVQRGAVHLHQLGARATAEFLVELAERADALPTIETLLRRYECITPEMLRVAGGNRFAGRRLLLVPQDTE